MTNARTQIAAAPLFLVASLAVAASPVDSKELCMEGTVGPVIVPVDVNGQSMNLMLDTSLPWHVFDKRVREQINGRPQSSSQDGVVESYANQRISACGLTDSYATQIMLMDIKGFLGLPEQAYPGFDGILGLPFLEYRVVNLDFDDNVVRILHRNMEKANDSETLSILRDEKRIPYLPHVSIGEQKVICEIATGFADSIGLRKATFDRLKSLGFLINLGTIDRHEFDERFSRRVAQAARVKVGAHEFMDVPVYESSSNKIGMALMRNFNITLDLGRNEVLLEKNGNYNPKIRTNDDVKPIHGSDNDRRSSTRKLNLGPISAVQKLTR